MNSISLVRPCPVCDHDRGTVVHEPANLPRVVCCQRCEMCFADTPHKQAWYDEYYATRSKYATGFEEWNIQRYTEAAERIARCVPKGASIIDVGCATGGLLAALNVAGFTKLAGADPSLDCVKKIPMFGFGVQATLFEVQQTWKGHESGGNIQTEWDCVILSHVLEHIRDVFGAMRKLTEIADTVYVEVPDAARYADNEVSPWSQVNHEHINHFTLSHLTQLFARHGFELRAGGEYECDPCRFPALWAYFGRQRFLAREMQRYVERSAALMADMEARIRAIKGPVICWGIGALARTLEPLLQNKVKQAIDSNAKRAGTMEWFANVPIGWPETLIGDYGSPILITTVLHQDAVKEEIRRRGLSNRVIVLRD